MFETDIRDFYPSINKKRLLSDILQCLSPDHSLADLLERAIDTTVSNFDDLDSRGLSEYWHAEQGVPQGGVLSPLFANFYLASFDKSLVDAGFHPVRYVDDLVVPTRTLEEAERAYHFCRDYLASMNLTIHGLNEPDAKGRVKSRIRHPNQHVDFLGLRFEKTTICPTPKKLEELASKIKTATNAFKKGATLVGVVANVNRLLKGWMAAYSCCDIPEDTLCQIDHMAGMGLVSWMRLIKLLKAKSLPKQQRQKIELWSVFEHQLSPLSKGVFTSEDHRQSQGHHAVAATNEAPF